MRITILFLFIASFLHSQYVNIIKKDTFIDGRYVELTRSYSKGITYVNTPEYNLATESIILVKSDTIKKFFFDNENYQLAWITNNNNTAITTHGMAAPTSIGTATAYTVSVTNRYTQRVKLDYLVTVAATTAIAGIRPTNLAIPLLVGNRGLWDFGLATGCTNLTKRSFTGWRSSLVTPTDVNPSTLTNLIGVGLDATDNTWQFIYNDGSGTATRVNTGINETMTDRTNQYILMIIRKSDGYEMIFKDLTTGITASHLATSNLPDPTVMYGMTGWHSVGGKSSVVGYGLSRFITEVKN